MRRVVAVDFDGTLCKNRWPEIGEPRTKVINYIKAFQEMGDAIVLWTCREGEMLDKAVAWCAEHGLTFDAVNDNIQERIERYGNNCRKISADFYIDDHNLLIVLREIGGLVELYEEE